MSGPASKCRELASRARYAALGTVARDRGGWPFVTLVAVAFDASARPLMCLSRLAEHTKNLLACPRASLLVSEADASPTPLAAGRMTLVGECTPMADDEAQRVRAVFLAVHPDASAYASFADFAWWRMEVAHARWVGGFGRMDWVDGGAYASARPDETA